MSDKDKEKKPLETDAEGTDDKDNDKDDDKDVDVKERKTRKIQITVSRDKEIEALTKELAEKDAMLEKEKEEREEREQKLADEKTAIEEELTEKKAILEKQALEAFEKEKKEILELAKSSNLSDEQMADIDERLTTPEKLEMVKALITMLAPKQDKTDAGDADKKPPSGKAPITPPPTRKGDSKVYDSPED